MRHPKGKTSTKAPAFARGEAVIVLPNGRHATVLYESKERRDLYRVVMADTRQTKWRLRHELARVTDAAH
jgi:hypothetical protein